MKTLTDFILLSHSFPLFISSTPPYLEKPGKLVLTNAAALYNSQYAECKALSWVKAIPKKIVEQREK